MGRERGDRIDICCIHYSVKLLTISDNSHFSQAKQLKADA